MTTSRACACGHGKVKAVSITEQETRGETDMIIVIVCLCLYISIGILTAVIVEKVKPVEAEDDELTVAIVILWPLALFILVSYGLCAIAPSIVKWLASKVPDIKIGD